MQFYSEPSREHDTWSLPDCEVFWAEEGELDGPNYYPDEEPNPAGFYYWFRFPGCLPDSDPYGPFETEDEAIVDCQTSY